MARQKGIIKLKGSIGDVSFYKSKNGYLAREKSGVDPERIKNDPAFQRTRENGSEFGRAGRAGRIIRTAFRPLLIRTADSALTSRLTRILLKVLQSDTNNVRGERRVQEGNLKLLQNFEFNEVGKLSATLYAPYEVAVDRVAGTAIISIPEFTPKDSLLYPQGATHMKLISAVAEVDFEIGTAIYASTEKDPVEISSEASAATELALNFTANSDKPVMLAFGIEFFQEVNGEMYAMNNGSYNCLAVVFIEAPAV